MSKAAVKKTYTIFNNRHMLLAYADDIDIIGRGLRQVTAAFSSIEKQMAEVGLVINEDKTKLFVSTNRESTRLGRYGNIDNYNFEVVDNFVYLGSAVNKNGNDSRKIKRRELIANHHYAI